MTPRAIKNVEIPREGEKVCDPIKYAGGYSLDLYCDHYHVFGEQHRRSFYGETFSECAREAKKLGWVIRPDHTATCPHHRKVRS